MRGKLTDNLLAKVDWQTLLGEIKRVIGVDVVIFNCYATKDGRLVWDTEDLIKHAGIMQAVFTSLKVNNFGGEYDKDRNDLWIPLDFSWEHHDGGTNGGALFHATWSFRTKEWTFRR